MKLFVAATAAVPALAGQCASQCSADILKANIVNKGTSDDWSLECNTNKTPDVNDETTSRKKDVWNIICQGEKIGEFSYQKRKAEDKCQNPDFKISCPDDCGCSDAASLISQVTNENDGNPFDIGIKCVKTVNSSKSNFEIFCDENGNGVYDENELTQQVITKNCKKFVNWKSLWSLNCGDGEQVSACGFDIADVQSAITNINEGNQYPVISECKKVLSGTKTKWRFTCDENDNGLPDEDESFQTAEIKNGKFSNVKVNCGDLDTCLGCLNTDFTTVNTDTKNPGDILISCGGTTGANTANIKVTCDKNANGFADEDEPFMLKEMTLRDDGSCDRNGKTEIKYKCRQNDVITTPPTTTTMPPTTPHSDGCFGCFEIGGPPGPDGINVPIESLITNVNTDPLPVLLRCVGPEDPDKEDVFNGNGRAILDAFCDKNKDGTPQEDEFIQQLTIKNRSKGQCEVVTPGAWSSIDCGNAICPAEKCDINHMLAGGNFISFDESEIRGECIEVQNGNKDTWRFWCDSNANGIFDENEKFILEDPSKDEFEIGPSGEVLCGLSQTLQCGRPEDGTCHAFNGENRCTKELIIGQKPFIDWYDRANPEMKNYNWEMFITEPDYEGQLDAYCDGVRTGSGGKIFEDWVVFCDDNKNGELDEDEINVTFETVYDYVYTGNDPKNFKAYIKHCGEEKREEENMLICGKKKRFVYEYIFEKEHFEAHNLAPKAIKQCGFKYMGPKYYGSPKLPDWDGETCTSDFMENALWDQGTQEGYVTGPNGTAGNIMVGGAGQLQQGMGRDYPFALPMDKVKTSWGRKDLSDVYGAKSMNVMQSYVPCYEQILKIGGTSYEYSQMYSLSKGERLFGWDTRNLMEVTQEATLFYMINYITGFFYDISVISGIPFWGQWDLKRMAEIHDFTRRIFRDHMYKAEESISNTNSIATLSYSGAEIMMGFEGQLGALDVWLNDTFTQFDERPFMANTLRAHKAHKAYSVKTHTSILYGNTNYQQLAGMNSVTKVQKADFEELNPGRTYIDRAIELYQNTGVGKFSISHYQAKEDNANEENEPTDFEAACIENTECYHKPDWFTLFSRPEMQPCPGTVGEWTSWSNCDRSCNEGVRIRTRKCFDSDGNELDAGFCEQDERELDMCNLQKCDDSIWEGKNSHWTEFGDLTDCDSNEVKSRHRLCNFSSEKCQGHECKDCGENKSDYRVKEADECKLRTIPNQCRRIYMATDYDHKCPAGDDIFIGFNQISSPNGYNGCPDAAWWFHMRHFFRITGYYDFEGIDENGNPKFTKLAHNIKITYNKVAESWVINNDGTNMAFAVSNAASPDHIDATKWNIRLEKDGYDRFVPTWKAAGEPWNKEINFHFECVEGDGFPENQSTDEPLGAQWTGWEEQYDFLGSKDDGFVNCQNACGDMRTKKRDRICSVEDLCIGTNFETKQCGGSKPENCPVQRGSCDADGFRAIYWQHLENEGFTPEFKDECYADHSKCQFGHNPPLKAKNFMNFANMEQYKQSDDTEGFYEFKFEWEEREDEIPFFNFKSGPSDFTWKQRKHFLEMEDEIMETWDKVGNNVEGKTDFLFDGLAWSNDKDWISMFDGVVDIGVEHVNGMGKQSRYTNWEPNWDIKENMKRNQNHYTVGTMADKQYYWPKFMGGWVSIGEIMDNSFVDGRGDRLMLGVDMQKILFRSPTKTTLKVKDPSC